MTPHSVAEETESVEVEIQPVILLEESSLSPFHTQLATVSADG